MAKKGNSQKASGRKGKTSPKMENPRFAKSKEKRGRGPIGQHLSEMDAIEKAQKSYVLIPECDLDTDSRARTRKGRRYWGRPTQKSRHLPIRFCQKHHTSYYDMCAICAQEKFETGGEPVKQTIMWQVGKVQLTHALDVASNKGLVELLEVQGANRASL